jgi:hypothetical protein
VKAPAKCRLIGRWQIFEADLWDHVHLDLCGPATLTITAQGGEIASALEAADEVGGKRNRRTSRRRHDRDRVRMNSSRSARFHYRGKAPVLIKIDLEGHEKWVDPCAL